MIFLINAKEKLRRVVYDIGKNKGWVSVGIMQGNCGFIETVMLKQKLFKM